MEMAILSFQETVDSAIRSETASEFGASPDHSFDSLLDTAIRSSNGSAGDFIASPFPLHAFVVERVLPNSDIYSRSLSGNVPLRPNRNMHEGKWKKGKVCRKGWISWPSWATCKYCCVYLAYNVRGKRQLYRSIPLSTQLKGMCQLHKCIRSTSELLHVVWRSCINGAKRVKSKTLKLLLHQGKGFAASSHGAPHHRAADSDSRPHQEIHMNNLFWLTPS
ncbi:hypothetical protein VNO78_30819 [Psophocarpus tetragonolobus]|uniref:Uncharacterized protein n=1 Tax=Psophocarpus tetragonolobus TaxID=3891 RepID=A0AAN9X5S4_PSOTE